MGCLLNPTPWCVQRTEIQAACRKHRQTAYLFCYIRSVRQELTYQLWLTPSVKFVLTVRLLAKQYFPSDIQFVHCAHEWWYL